MCISPVSKNNGSVFPNSAFAATLQTTATGVMRISCISNAVSWFLFRGEPHRHVCLQGSFSEAVSISNLGIAKTGPTVEDSGSLLLEYVNGSACTTSDGRRTNYSTRIHLVCSRGSMVRRCSSCDLGCSACFCDRAPPHVSLNRPMSLGVGGQRS